MNADQPSGRIQHKEDFNDAATRSFPAASLEARFVGGVTTRNFNLYIELLSLFGCSDPAFPPNSPSIDAATCRGRKIGGVPKLETWAYPLVVDNELPELPIWLSEHLNVMLDLEASYEATCRGLRIP
jgi:hypothetical protein